MAASQAPEIHTNSEYSDGEEIRERRAGEERAMATSEELENLTDRNGDGEEVRRRRANDGEGVRRRRAGEERAMATSENLTSSDSDGEGVRRRRRAGDGESELSPRAVVRHENPFFFWLAFTSTISLIMVFFIVTARLLNWNNSIELLAMPPRVRAHFEAGKLLKVEVGEDQTPVKSFVRASPSRGENVLLLPGIGSSSFSYRTVISLLAERGIAAVAVDLPGAGLAEKTRESEAEERELGFLGSRFAALKELLAEGFSPRAEENEFLVKLRTGTKKRKQEALALGARELSDAVDQVVASLELPPVHLVAHDTGAEAALAWALLNAAKVASVTLVDAAATRSPSLPVWLLQVPLLGSLIANSDLAFRWILRWCCFASVTAEDAGDYGYLLRSSGGLRALLGTVAASNSSMDVAEWALHSNLEGVPKQILWASGWSEEWRREGEQLAAAVPGAAFHSHCGSRWPQEDAAPEIADMIAQFVKSLPSHRSDDEPLFELGQNSRSRESHGYNHGQHHHSHEHELGYMEGVGQTHGGWVL